MRRIKFSLTLCKKLRQKPNNRNFNTASLNLDLGYVPENYKYSSARFYETGIKNFEFLTHFNDF